MWGLVHSLKDLPALWQSLILFRHLGCWPDPVARAYLDSDLLFLAEMFSYFDFSTELRRIPGRFLEAAQQEWPVAEPAQQGMLFDLEAGKAANKDALERFGVRARDWLVRAREAAREICRRKGPVTRLSFLQSNGG